MSLEKWGTKTDIQSLVDRGYVSEAISISMMRTVWSYFCRKSAYRAELVELKGLLKSHEKVAQVEIQRLISQAVRVAEFPGSLDPMEDALISSNINSALCSALGCRLAGLPHQAGLVERLRELLAELPERHSLFAPVGINRLCSKTVLEELDKFS